MVVSFDSLGDAGVSKAFKTPTFRTTIFLIVGGICFPKAKLALVKTVSKGGTPTSGCSVFL